MDANDDEDKHKAAALFQSMTELWTKFKSVNEQRFAAVSAAATALRGRRLNPEIRKLAYQEAHKLAGALGTFGLKEGSRVAKKIELLLVEDLIDLTFFDEQVAALREEIDRGPRPPDGSA